MGSLNHLKALLLVALVVGHYQYVRCHDEDFDEDPTEATTVKDDVKIENLEDSEFKVEYNTPNSGGPVHFAEHFDDLEAAKQKWIISKAQKSEQENTFKYDGVWDFDLPDRVIFPNDRGLILRSKAKHAAISAKLERRFEFTTKPLYVQYEVTFQNGMECGGAYIKLLSHSKDLDLNKFHDKTPYTIMFGPDKCGNDIKLHFIFRHKNPITGVFEEKHAKRPSNRMEEVYSDKRPHRYRLVLTPDNKFEQYVDEVRVNQGSLLTDMSPPVNPPEEIEDSNDKKPSDWDERERIPDSTASKPLDWDEDAPAKIPDPNAVMPDGWLEDEPEMIVDETAIKPEDWDESMDGTWEPPLIPNPNCAGAPGCGPWSSPLIENPNFKGKWKPPMVSNPNYKGKWAPRKMPNPDYFEDKEPFKMTPISAVGLEIWTMTDGVLFDNFIITDNELMLEDWTEQTFGKKKLALDRDAEGYIQRIIKYSNAHPWLWAVYIVVIGLPLVLIFTFCCSQEKKIGDHKKTDAPVEDSVDEEPQPKKTKSPKVSRPSAAKTRVSKSREELEQNLLDSDDESSPEEASISANTDETEEIEKAPSPKAGKGSKNIIDLNAASQANDAPRKRTRARKE